MHILQIIKASTKNLFKEYLSMDVEMNLESIQLYSCFLLNYFQFISSDHFTPHIKPHYSSCSVLSSHIALVFWTIGPQSILTSLGQWKTM